METKPHLKTSSVASDARTHAPTGELPSALDRLAEIRARIGAGRPAIFLDYDGTLTPIVSRPQDARLSASTRRTLRRLAARSTVAVVSGRDLRDVQALVAIPEIFYAGSHGFEIAGPEGRQQRFEQGGEFLPNLDEAQAELEARLRPVRGAQVERKRFSVAAHYRNVALSERGKVASAVRETLARHPRLRLSPGKMVFDLQPAIDWNKGKALLWLLDALALDPRHNLPLYIGDDLTDEDAFRALRRRGIGIVVREASRPTAARYALENPAEVRRFLEALIP
jgi:trehalose 6-phosphate phosphatase